MERARYAQRDHIYSLLLAAGISQSEGETKERVMKPAIKLLLKRSLVTLGAILVWAKALAGGRADEQTQSTPETDQKTAGGRQQEPNRKP